jgi:hypothetical protein
MRIDVQFSGQNSRPQQIVRDFHAPCGESEPQGERNMEVFMTIGASVVMIIFVGLLLKALA